METAKKTKMENNEIEQCSKSFYKLYKDNNEYKNQKDIMTLQQNLRPSNSREVLKRADYASYMNFSSLDAGLIDSYVFSPNNAQVLNLKNEQENFRDKLLLLKEENQKNKMKKNVQSELESELSTNKYANGRSKSFSKCIDINSEIIKTNKMKMYYSNKDKTNILGYPDKLPDTRIFSQIDMSSCRNNSQIHENFEFNLLKKRKIIIKEDLKDAKRKM